MDKVRPEEIDFVQRIFSEKIPFNNFLGLELQAMAEETASFRIAMRPELVGNYVRGNLHGGVISSVLDVTGGLVAFLGALHRLAEAPFEEKLDRFSRMGTIDLRVDYLRPGLGEHFVSTGFLLRSGSRVAVTRMELHNDQDSLIAVGTGTYIVG